MHLEQIGRNGRKSLWHSVAERLWLQQTAVYHNYAHWYEHALKYLYGCHFPQTEQIPQLRYRNIGCKRDFFAETMLENYISPPTVPGSK